MTPLSPSSLLSSPDSEHSARSIAAQVTVTYKNASNNLLLTTRDAIAASSFYPLELEDIVVGDPDAALEASKHKVV